ncbi:hypothetical protein ACZ87_03042 [Candidatus Erwinia dacicola]|uniref:Uncharacterized protein n=1 Tax=Candidatus Erwinia dacicola TaxID=252393 RepID=A0A328TI71_9GAMM|nr:hypothetical protein ACZ87_03042 [Candidatus Erwinia dacicola]
MRIPADTRDDFYRTNRLPDGLLINFIDDLWVAILHEYHLWVPRQNLLH